MPVDIVRLLISTRHDLTIIAIAALLAAMAVSSCPAGARRWVVFFYSGFTYFHCAILAINVPAVQWTGASFTLQWFYLADFLQSSTSRESIFPILSPHYLLALILIATAALWVRMLVVRLPMAWTPNVTLAFPVLILIVASVLFALSATVPPQPVVGFTTSAQSPVAVLVRSFFARTPVLRHEKIRSVEADPVMAASPTHIRQLNGAKRPNIVVVALESVGAHAVRSDLRRLPTLSNLMNAGVAYNNAYASDASTTESIFSLLVSRYPPVGVKAATLSSENFVSLPERLTALGYRTGYFGVDLQYLGTGSFLRRMKMGEIYDAPALHCPDSGWDRTSFDKCLLGRVARWAQGREPFFAIAWTNDTHFPYGAGTSGGPLGSVGAYEAALRSTDAALGEFIRALGKNRSGRDTIFVIVGDHGEAFGEHGARVHSSTIFDEETRVPLVIYSTAFRTAREDPRTARLIDIPPTILQLAGGSPERSWAGLDLFSGLAARRAFMFAEYQGLQIGFAEGPRKYILDYGSGRFSRFDLRSDPDELHPIPLSQPQRIQAEGIVGSWIDREAH